MKIFNFNTYNEFLERFDGKINAVYNKSIYLCDLEESDLIKFLNENKISDDSGYYYLKSDDYKQEILSEAIYINIRDEKRRTN